MSRRTSSTTARLFVSISLPEAARAEVARAAERLRPHADGFRWSASDTYHVTLRFLGDVEMRRASSIADALRHAVRDLAPFSFGLERAGAFPSPRRPRVLWIGGTAGSPLTRLHEGVATALADVGFDPEGRPFSPHVTIARLRRGVARAESLAGALADVRVAAAVPVRSVALMRSRLGPAGARHEPVAIVGLDGS